MLARAIREIEIRVSDPRNLPDSAWHHLHRTLTHASNRLTHKPPYDGKSRTCVFSQQVSKTLRTWVEGWKGKFICSDKPDCQTLNLNT